MYADGAPAVDAALFDTGIPVFGICYGFQAMAQAAKGRCRPNAFGSARIGGTKVTIALLRLRAMLLKTCPRSDRCGWRRAAVQ